MNEKQVISLLLNQNEIITGKINILMKKENTDMEKLMGSYESK